MNIAEVNMMNYKIRDNLNIFAFPREIIKYKPNTHEFDSI